MQKLVWTGPMDAPDLSVLLGRTEWRIKEGGKSVIIYAPDDIYTADPGDTICVTDDGEIVIHPKEEK